MKETHFFSNHMLMLQQINPLMAAAASVNPNQRWLQNGKNKSL